MYDGRNAKFTLYVIRRSSSPPEFELHRVGKLLGGNGGAGMPHERGEHDRNQHTKRDHNLKLRHQRYRAGQFGALHRVGDREGQPRAHFFEPSFEQRGFDDRG